MSPITRRQLAAAGAVLAAGAAPGGRFAMAQTPAPARPAPDLMLLSNSRRTPQLRYFEHALPQVEAFLDGRRTVHFVPYALLDMDGSTANQVAGLEPLGVEVIGLHTLPDPLAAIEAAEVVLVGGGNTFRLVKRMEELGLMEPIRRRVLAGELSYMGSSAGTNLACPTVRTTNDMPIVQPASLDAIGLIPFQINPHYEDPDPNSTHMGETRAQRLDQFLEENDVPVLGIREGSWLRVQGDRATMGGETGALLFARGQEEPAAYGDGDDLSFLLATVPRYDARD